MHHTASQRGSDALPEEQIKRKFEAKPRLYIPTLYFIEGLPYAIVNLMSIAFFKNLNASNEFIGVGTSLLSFPWVIKLLWAPLVDLYSTRRTWILVAHAVLAALCVCLCLSILFPIKIPFLLTIPFFGNGLALKWMSVSVPEALTVPIALLVVIGVFSATQDVAIDGFYMDVLDKEGQSLYVGVRNAAYKIAWLTGQGALVFVAGIIAEHYGLGYSVGWAASFGICALLLGAAFAFHSLALPHPKEVHASATRTEATEIFAEASTEASTETSAEASTEASTETSAAAPTETSAAASTETSAAAAAETSAAASTETSAAASTETSAAAAAETSAAAAPETSTETPARASSKAKEASGDPSDSALYLMRTQFTHVFKTFFTQKGIVAIVAYILLFRLGDAFMLKMAQPFLLDPPEKGGLGIPTSELGIIYGAVGTTFLLLGGIAGSWLIATKGLRNWLLPTAIIQNSAILLYWMLAVLKPGAPVVAVVNAFEQFSYGLGSAAYTVYLLSTVKPEYKAAHYAIATGMMAFGLMIPGVLSGFLTELGYPTFFLISFAAAIPGIITIFLLPFKEESGKAVAMPTEQSH